VGTAWPRCRFHVSDANKYRAPQLISQHVTLPKRVSANPTISLVLVSLRTGVAIKRVTLGVAVTATVLSCARAMVIVRCVLRYIDPG
jgi:hypothetical protein